VRRLVAAPDKFRGTATAAEVATAIASGARAAGWNVDRFALSDGGEGFIDALGGTRRVETVRGPLGDAVTARWTLDDDGTAYVESAQAVGRALLRRPRGDDPLRASTYGVGELLAAAIAAGAARVVVGCGGTSSTDGGLGCIDALEDHGLLDAISDVPIVAAVDVDVLFLEAPSQFGPQKGASPQQVAELDDQLAELAARYLTRFGIDVRSVEGSGAGGGLAGGLVALGAEVVRGARLVAGKLGLPRALEHATLVVTGEGRLDAATLRGKVVEEVLATAPALDALVVVGESDARIVAKLGASRPGRVDVRSVGTGAQDRRATRSGIERIVKDYLTALG
jgi:glycerate 2-kinase